MGNLERETGIEPATNSLEGCDSTTELLPPTQLATAPTRCYGGQARRVNFQTPTRSASCRQTNNATNRTALSTHGLGGWWGGVGSNLRSPMGAGLQPAAIDRSATPPNICLFEVFARATGP